MVAPLRTWKQNELVKRRVDMLRRIIEAENRGWGAATREMVMLSHSPGEERTFHRLHREGLIKRVRPKGSVKLNLYRVTNEGMRYMRENSLDNSR